MIRPSGFEVSVSGSRTRREAPRVSRSCTRLSTFAGATPQPIELDDCQHTTRLQEVEQGLEFAAPGAGAPLGGLDPNRRTAGHLQPVNLNLGRLREG